MTIYPATISIILLLLGHSADSAVVHTWSGATENACRDRCPQDWAENQLTKEELTQLRAEQKLHPEPYAIMVHDGDVFDMMTYFKDGKPRAYRTTTIAKLDAPEGSAGWTMGDWSFVKLDACSNWAILRKQNIGSMSQSFDTGSLAPIGAALVPVAYEAAVNGGSSGTSSGGPSWSTGGGDWPTPVGSTPDCTRCKPVPPCPPVAAVPVPAAALLLLTALIGLILLKRKVW